MVRISYSAPIGSSISPMLRLAKWKTRREIFRHHPHRPERYSTSNSRAVATTQPTEDVSTNLESWPSAIPTRRDTESPIFFTYYHDRELIEKILRASTGHSLLRGRSVRLHEALHPDPEISHLYPSDLHRLHRNRHESLRNAGPADIFE